MKTGKQFHQFDDTFFNDQLREYMAADNSFGDIVQKSKLSVDLLFRFMYYKKLFSTECYLKDFHNESIFFKLRILYTSKYQLYDLYAYIINNSNFILIRQPNSKLRKVTINTTQTISLNRLYTYFKFIEPYTQNI